LVDPEGKIANINIVMYMNFDHVIITRFSYQFNPNKPIPDLLSDHRLYRRFQLFETFCLPSILNQSCQNFHWIILIDQNLPQKYRERLDILTENRRGDAKSGHTLIHPWNHLDRLSQTRWIGNLIPLEKRFLITSRVDDDDSLNQNFVHRIQYDFKKIEISEFHLLTYPDGCYWKWGKRTKNGEFFPASEPLIAIGLSLIVCLAKCPFTVFFDNHTKLIEMIKAPDKCPILKKFCSYNPSDSEKYYSIVRTSPMYIRTVHDTNDQALIRIKNKNALDAGEIGKAFKLNYVSLCDINSSILERKKNGKMHNLPATSSGQTHDCQKPIAINRRRINHGFKKKSKSVSRRTVPKRDPEPSTSKVESKPIKKVVPKPGKLLGERSITGVPHSRNSVRVIKPGRIRKASGPDGVQELVFRPPKPALVMKKLKEDAIRRQKK